MRLKKFYKTKNGQIHIIGALIGRNRSWDSRCPGIAQLQDQALAAGFTEKKPHSLKPHRHPHQQPGYRQPSAQQSRRDRQAISRAKEREAA